MNEEYDVFIVGAGIVACTFARILVDAGLKVVMADAGAQHSQQAGENLKNFQNYQTDVDQFGGIVRGLMHPVSIPVAPGQPFTRNALNPYQKADKNLPGAVAAYAVGGMAIHWTCAIPRHHKDLERIKFISDNEWEDIYSDAEIRLKRNTDVHTSSLRHQVLKNVLKRYKRTEEVKETPLAAVREGTESVRYTGADTVLKDLADPGETKKLTILREHRVSKLNYHGSRVQSVEVRDLKKREDKVFHAGVFVVAAGWVHTAQILWNSQIRPTALGKYLTDHTFTACQVVLKKEIIDEVREEASKNPHNNVDSDPLSLPIPMNDPPPHLYIPVSEGRPWHSQIFREAFQFDPLAPSVDSRLIVDLKWFGMIHPNEYNQMTFEDKIKDRLGLPQPTFEFMLSADDKDREHQMFLDMQEVAFVLGDYLRGSEPRRIALGASTHTMGATRMGDKDDGTSVVDSHSKVWGFDNLYLGGNCVIPTANASNPTLTSVALAIRAVTHIMTSQTNSKLVGLTNNIQK